MFPNEEESDEAPSTKSVEEPSVEPQTYEEYVYEESAECARHSDCEAPTICDGAHCFHKMCRENFDCEVGTFCADSRCRPHTCSKNRDCPGNDQVGGSSGGGNLTCNVAAGVCDTTRCPDEGPACKANRVCREGFCLVLLCDSDVDCGEAEICSFHTCAQRPCRKHADCLSGRQECDLERGLCQIRKRDCEYLFTHLIFYRRRRHQSISELCQHLQKPFTTGAENSILYLKKIRD